MQRQLAIILLSLLAFVSPPAEAAAGLSFDCDVPADHYASVSQVVGTSPAISGTIQTAELRSGKNLPVAGARFASPDNSDSLGFQLIVDDPHAKQFEIVLNAKMGGALKSYELGKVDMQSPVRFDLSITTKGMAKLTIGNREFGAEFKPILTSTAMAFCSTGQFKFAGLQFSKLAN